MAGLQAGLRTRAQTDAADAAFSLCIAYSGGLDSTVLLHAAARMCAAHPGYSLRAVYIDHQLHADSGRWRAHCESIAASLGVPCEGRQVEVRRQAGKSLEAAAREARYAALAGLLEPQELLLTAHHADDQLETVLLALMRGAGPRGLSAMLPAQRLGQGWLMRPLLAFTRAELEAWAYQERLDWIHDPSNGDTAFDRNYLRHRILPVLQERWPAAARSAARSASHLGEASGVLDAVAAADLPAVGDGTCLDVDMLRALNPARRRNLLRYWIRRHGMSAPSTRKLAAIEHDMLVARKDRVPCVVWEGGGLRRHAGLLYCVRTLGGSPGVPGMPGGEGVPEKGGVSEEGALRWRTAQPFLLPQRLGRLRLVPGSPGSHPGSNLGSDPTGGPVCPTSRSEAAALALGKLPAVLDVRFRRGGESLRPAGDAHHRKLKKLLQSRGVLPWWREYVPLIYSDGRLVAVGNLWVAQEFAAVAGEPSARIVWDGGPDLLSSQRRLR